MNGGLLFLVICFPGPFILPLVIGLYLLGRGDGSDLTRLAAYLTLKPLVATPLWLWVVLLATSAGQAAGSPAYILLSTLVGVGVTFVIVWNFHSSDIWRRRPAAWILLALDTVRWGSTALFGSRGIPVE